MSDPRPDPDKEEKVSLPFTPEEIMAGLLAVNPDDLPDDEKEPEQPE